MDLLLGHLQALAKQQRNIRNIQQVLLLHFQSDWQRLTLSSSPPAPGEPAQLPPPPPHCPLSAIIPPRCPGAVQPHRRAGSSLVPQPQPVPGKAVLFPASPRDQGLTRHSSPKARSLRPHAPSHYTELQAPTCKISLVHVTFPLGAFQNRGFNPLEFLKSAFPPKTWPWEEVPPQEVGSPFAGWGSKSWSWTLKVVKS